MKSLMLSACAVAAGVVTLNAYNLPDATAHILVFSDQLNDATGSANLTFNATHFVGMQKIDKARVDEYKRINPNFIVVQYHKSYGVDLQSNITSATAPYWHNDCDTFYAWVNRHPSYGARESYYLHYSNIADSVHRIGHLWNGVNEYYLADLRHAGWRQYVAEENVWRCQNLGFDGTFFDATYFPSYGYVPDTWFDSVPYNAGGITNFGTPWNQTFALPYWGSIRRFFHSGANNYLCLVNCDQMVTGWYQDAYNDSVDGAMMENFFTYGGKLTGGDWSLSAGRALQYLTGAGKSKVLIAQCSPDPTDMSLRRWCIANYLLLKNKYGYFNYASSTQANWWPEYGIALDSFVTQPSTLNDLLVAGTTSLYKRDFKNGMVLVNPGTAPQSMITAQRFLPITFSGGGDVTNGVAPAMTLSYGAAVTGSLSVGSGEVLILQKEGTATIAGPRAMSPARAKGGACRIYDLTGRLTHIEKSDIAHAGHSAGVYVIPRTAGSAGRIGVIVN